MNASHVNLYENQSETGSEPAAARMALMERTIKAVKAEALSSTSIQARTSEYMNRTLNLPNAYIVGGTQKPL